MPREVAACRTSTHPPAVTWASGGGLIRTAVWMAPAANTRMHPSTTA